MSMGTEPEKVGQQKKIDGTCCLIKDGKIYRRYDYKKGRTLPQGAIPCQEAPDPITGHFPHWLLCTENDPIEGIVFYRGNREMCKIKRSDFGFKWNRKKK